MGAAMIPSGGRVVSSERDIFGSLLSMHFPEKKHLSFLEMKATNSKEKEGLLLFIIF